MRFGAWSSLSADFLRGVDVLMCYQTFGDERFVSQRRRVVSKYKGFHTQGAPEQYKPSF